MLKIFVPLGVLILADVPWWNDAAPANKEIVPAIVKMPLNGGVSLDGKCQIFVVGKDPMDHDYAFGFYRDENKHPFFEVNFNAGFCVLRGASQIDSALWNEDGTLVAIQDHDTRHSMSIHLLLVKGDQVIRIQLPPFGSQMSKKKESQEGQTAVCKPLKWNGTDFTFRLFLGSIASDVTLRAIKSDKPKAEVVSETPPEAN